MLTAGSSSRKIVDLDGHIVCPKLEQQWYLLIYTQNDDVTLVASDVSVIERYRDSYGIVEVEDFSLDDLTNAFWTLHDVGYTLTDGVLNPAVVGEY